MKSSTVGDTATSLLWPSPSAMRNLRRLSRPYNSLVLVDADAPDLLWPARLINEQARRRKPQNPARILATLAFIASLVLALLVGPIQLILIATMLDYNWTATVYYPTVLQFVLPLSSLVAALTAVAIVLGWHSHPKFTRTVTTLSLGTLTEIALLWLFGCVLAVQPHTLSLIFIVTTLGFFVATLYVAKQYTPATENSRAMRIFCGCLLTIAAVEILLGPLYLVESATSRASSNFEQLSAEQAAARIDGVPELLSNMVFTLCGGRYQVVYQSTSSESGIFECSQTHRVYSVENLGEQNLHSVHGAATFLGTTRDTDITLAFPTAYYLYRDLPSLDRAELALMVPAHSERELVDDFTAPLLAYWQARHDRNLAVSLFYNDDISTITYTPSEPKLPASTTRNYVLMAAMGIMTLTNDLPDGNTYRSPFGSEMMNYIFKPDQKLTALSELGANPNLYAQSSRNSLKSHRYISLYLDHDADAEITYDELYARLEASFVQDF